MFNAQMMGGDIGVKGSAVAGDAGPHHRSGRTWGTTLQTTAVIPQVSPGNVHTVSGTH